MKRFAICVACALLCAFGTGCSNYRLAGTAAELPFHSIYVRPVRNFSYAPQAAALLTNSISQSLMQSPDLTLANPGDAQAELQTEIVDYRRTPIATQSYDTALAASCQISATAKCTLKRSNGEVIFKDRKVTARTIIYLNSVGNGLIGDEYQNMPVLMRELGGKIKDAVLGIW